MSAKVNEWRALLNTALDALREKGLAVVVGPCQYGPSAEMTTHATFSVQLAHERPGDGLAMTREAQLYVQLAPEHGLSPDWLGRTFTNMGMAYKIIGWRPRARRLLVQCVEVETGKLFRFSVRVVARGMRRQEVAP